MFKLNLAVVGSRDITDYVIFRRYALGAFYMLGFGVSDVGKVTSGGADGADEIGMDFSIKNTIDFVAHVPEWKTIGVKDAFARNGVIAKECHAAIVLWDGESRGTENTLDQLDDLGKPYILVRVKVTKTKRGVVIDQTPVSIDFKRPIMWGLLYDKTNEPDSIPGRGVRDGGKQSRPVKRSAPTGTSRRKAGTSVRPESSRGNSKRKAVAKNTDRRRNGRGKA